MSKRKTDQMVRFDQEAGERARFAREQRGVGQKQLGRLLGLEPLYRHEVGARGFTFWSAAQLCRELDISLHWLAFGEDYQPRKRQRQPGPHELVIGEFERSGVVGELSMAERHGLYEHLRRGNSKKPSDLEFLVKQWRYQAAGDEQSMREFFDAQDKRAQELGNRKRKPTGEPQIAPHKVASAHRRRKDDR